MQGYSSAPTTTARCYQCDLHGWIAKICPMHVQEVARRFSTWAQRTSLSTREARSPQDYGFGRFVRKAGVKTQRWPMMNMKPQGLSHETHYDGRSSDALQPHVGLPGGHRAEQRNLRSNFESKIHFRLYPALNLGPKKLQVWHRAPCARGAKETGLWGPSGTWASHTRWFPGQLRS